MRPLSKFLTIKFFLLFNLFFSSHSISDNHNFYEILEQLQKDIKTLEKAVYLGQTDVSNNNSVSTSLTGNNNSEDVLTRHLLKLSEIESQFQELTNKFEEINFKLDKLSNRMSKVQSDNQLRFQNLESSTSNFDTNKNIGYFFFNFFNIFES